MPISLQAIVSVLVLTDFISVLGQSVASLSPKSSPVTGQTTIAVYGSGFIKVGSSRSNCYFRIVNGARRSIDTEVINSTFLHCPTPDVPFLDRSSASYVVTEFQVTADANFSVPHQFIFFDLDRITIKSMNPVEGGVATGGVVTVWGEDFVDTKEIVCLVNGTRLAIGLFINSTAIRCHLPPLYPSRRVIVKISLNNGDSTGIIPANDSLTTFTFYHDAPQLISVYFSKSLSTVSLEFGIEVEIGDQDEANSNRSPDCRTVLDEESYQLIGGNDAVCHWATQQQRRIIVALPATAKVVIGSILSLRGGNIRARWQQYSRLASGNKTVTVPFEVHRPVAIIEGPSVIPSCGNVTVTGRNSQGIGYARLTYEWWLYSDTRNALPDLRGNNLDTVQLLSDWFVETATYKIHLKVRSPLGFESETANYTLTKANTPVPVIEILGPVNRRIHCLDDLYLESKASLPACASQTTTVSYLWTVTQENGDPASLHLIPRNTPTLFIPQGTLGCNQAYHFRVTVRSSDSLQGTDTSTDSPMIAIYTERQTLDARIVGGTAWSISELQELKLDGSRSHDPNGINGNVGYDWDCVLYHSAKPCLNASSRDALVFPQDNKVSIEPGYLRPNQSYLITLNYTKGWQFNVAQAVVTVTDQPEEAPVVGIITPGNSEAVNPSEQITIEALVSSHFEATVQWECVSEDPGFGALNLTDPAIVTTPYQYQLIDISDFHPARNDDIRKYLLIATDDDDLRSVFLVLRPNSLLPNIPYRFRLNATNRYGSNFAEVTVRTSSVPSGCILIITPEAGWALETLFTIQAKGCAVESDRYPLVYRYGIKRNGTNEIHWFGGSTADNTLLTYLPVGVQENGFELPIYVRAEDNRGVHQTFSSVAVVNTSKSYDLTSLKTRILEEFKTNWPVGLRTLQAVLSMINAEPISFGTADISSFAAESVNILSHLSNTTLPKRKDELMQLIGTLVELTETGGLENSPVAIVTAINLIESVISDIVLTEGNNLFDHSFTAHEGTQVFNIYNYILSNNLEETLRQQAKESFHWSLKTVGFGLSRRQSYGSEKQSTVFALGALETSVATPVGSHPVGCSSKRVSDCPFDSSTGSVVDLGTILGSKYSTWSCDADEICNGVCTVFAQITVNLFEMRSPHDPVRKSDIVVLSLLDPKSGEELEVKDLALPIGLEVKLTVESDRKGVILCMQYDEERRKWSSDGCNAKVSLPDTEKLVVGSIIHCECNLLSIFLVIERCPPGYFGVQCENMCPQGLWGQDCSNVCSCSSRGQCDPVNGQCDCNSGWIGNSCQNRCTEGYWGKSCSLPCHCQNGALCIPQTGECQCQPGWIGKNCSESCPVGSYGLHCRQSCQCKNGANCSADTGDCTCAPGFRGTDCSGVCPTWTYGWMCKTQCLCHPNGSSQCHHITGDCTCLEKWNGTLCNETIQEPMKPAPGFPAWTIGVALLIITLVIAGILVFLYIRKRRHGSMVIHPEEEVDGKEDDEDDEVTITKARSLEFILQTKPGTRERIEWEVAKVKAPPRRKRKSVHVVEEEDEEEDEEEPVPEILPKKIRLPPDGTLADLREALTQENWFEEGTTVKFLLRGDQRLFYSRDQEPVVILAQVFVEDGGFRRIYVLERKETKRRKTSRAVSGKQRHGSMRRTALRNASASSRITRSQTSMSATSYSSYTTDGSYSESFTETEEESGSETEESEASGSETGSYTSRTDSTHSQAESNQERPPTAKSQHSMKSTSPQSKRSVSPTSETAHPTSTDDKITDDKLDEKAEGNDHDNNADNTKEKVDTDNHSTESQTQLIPEPSTPAKDGNVKVDNDTEGEEVTDKNSMVEVDNESHDHK